MRLYATVTSERGKEATKGGNEYLDIVITGANETELITLRIHPNGSLYELRGWTHDNQFIQHMINENTQRKSEHYCAYGRVDEKPHKADYLNDYDKWVCEKHA